MLRAVVVLAVMLPGVLAAQAIVRGRILDSTTSQPVGYATVSLHNLRDTSKRAVRGALSLPDGTFLIRAVPVGLYRLQVRMLGYRTAVRDSLRVPASGEVSIGTLRLQSEAIEQRAVEVRAERELQEAYIDRRVYRVGKDLTVAGGTAADALQNVPGVTIDQDRTLQLRGSSNVVVLVDGKPTTLTGGERSGGTGLDNIPADAIDAVEVVTTPDARYDAEGGAGIVNIILKRERSQPFTAFGSVTIGTRDKYTGFASIGVRTGAVRFDGSYNYTRQTFDFDRRIWLVPYAGEPGTQYPGLVTGSRPIRTETHAPRLAVESDVFDGRGRLSATLGGIFQYQRTRGELSYDYFLHQANGQQPVPSGYSEHRMMSQQDTTTGFDASLGYRHRIGQDWSLSTDVRYLINRTRTQVLGSTRIPRDAVSARNQSTSSQQLEQASAQADVTYRIPSGGQLDGGLKVSWRQLQANQTIGSDTTDPLAAVLTGSVAATVTEDIWAGYVQATLPLGALQLSGGLRAEATRFNVTGDTEQFLQTYWNLFPSLSLAYRISPLYRVALRYSRRISRPSPGALAPLVNLDDPYNLRSGTPTLQPELVHSLELNTTAVLPWVTLSPSLYWRWHQNLLARYRTYDTLRSVTRLVFANWDRMDVGGFELLLQAPITSWWRTTAVGSIAYQRIDAGSVQPGLSNSGWTATFNWQNVFAIADGWSAQLGYNLRRIGPIAQGSIGTIRAGELALRYEFLEGRGSVALRLSDPFDERVFTVAMRTATFDQDLRFKRESRIAFLTLSYLFGSGKPPTDDDQIRPPSDEM
jgi:outer membrane receptor protein involved in Fe transport